MSSNTQKKMKIVNFQPIPGLLPIFDSVDQQTIKSASCDLDLMNAVKSKLENLVSPRQIVLRGTKSNTPTVFVVDSAFNNKQNLIDDDIYKCFPHLVLLSGICLISFRIDDSTELCINLIKDLKKTMDSPDNYLNTEKCANQSSLLKNMSLHGAVASKAGIRLIHVSNHDEAFVVNMLWSDEGSNKFLKEFLCEKSFARLALDHLMAKNGLKLADPGIGEPCPFLGFGRMGLIFRIREAENEQGKLFPKDSWKALKLVVTEDHAWTLRYEYSCITTINRAMKDLIIPANPVIDFEVSHCGKSLQCAAMLLAQVGTPIPTSKQKIWPALNLLGRIHRTGHLHGTPRCDKLLMLDDGELRWCNLQRCRAMPFWHLSFCRAYPTSVFSRDCLPTIALSHDISRLLSSFGVVHSGRCSEQFVEEYRSSDCSPTVLRDMVLEMCGWRDPAAGAGDSEPWGGEDYETEQGAGEQPHP